MAKTKATKTSKKAPVRARARAGANKPVSEIVRNATPDQRRTWFDAAGGQAAPIAGMSAIDGGIDHAAIVPAMYAAWGAYGYQPAITWYQLANMYTSWEYTATEKIARTIAGLPAKLYRYENTQGKTMRPYFVKNLILHDIQKHLSQRIIDHKLKKDHGIQRIEIDEHPFLDLIHAPNEEMIRFNFWRLLVIHLELNGAVGVYKAMKDGFGNPRELHVLPTTWTGQLKPIPATDGVRLIAGYRLLDQDLHTLFDKDEIMWIHYTSLRNPYEGMSALKAQLYAFNMDQYLMQQVSAFYKNGAMFSNIFKTEQQLTQTQYNEIAAQLANYQGAKNAGQKFILHSGLDMVNATTSTARDAMIDEIQKMARDKLLSSHDVSAGKVGLVESQNRSNLDTVDMAFFNESIKPRAMLITEYFDRFLVRNYDENISFEFDYPHFQDRALDMQERTSNITNGITSRNEERDKMGLEPVEGGDVILVSPMNAPLADVANPPPAPTPSPSPADGAPSAGAGGEGASLSGDDGDGAAKPPASQGEGEEELEDVSVPDPKADLHGKPASKAGYSAGRKAFWTPEKKALAWKKFDREAKAYEPLFKRVMVKFFRETAAATQDLIEKHGVKIKSNIGAMSFNGRQRWLAEHKDRLDELIPAKADMKKRLKRDMQPVYYSVIDAAGKTRADEFLKQLGKKDPEAKAKRDGSGGAVEYEFEFNVNDPSVKKWIGERLEEFSEVTAQTTIDDTRRILREDFENGEPLLKMGEDLREYYTGAETYRANLIARTEATSAMTKGDMEAVDQMGLGDVAAKVWLDEPDEATRPTHREAGKRYSDGYDAETGEIMRLNKKFIVGEDKMLHPAGGSLAEENCNCRCGIVYEIIEGGRGSSDAADFGGEGDKALKESGNFGHAGRPGEVGGSLPQGAGADCHYEKGKGWLNSDGTPIPSYVSERGHRQMAPGWHDVRYNLDPEATVLAVGRDKAGRRQAIYQKEFMDANQEAKFERVWEMNEKIDGIMKEINSDIKSGENKEEASCLRLVATTGLRPGSEKDTGAEKQAYGATTLLAEHVKGDNPNNVRLEFVGKKGVDLNLPVEDKAVAKDLLARREAAGKDGKIFATDAEKLSSYSQGRDGGGYKTKDFRTSLATRTALSELKKYPKPTTQKEYKATVKAIATTVSQKLGNTPSVALKSYIHPAVWTDWSVK